MGRINYGIRLIIRIAFIIVCFVMAFLSTAIGQYRADEIVMTGTAAPPYCEITQKNGAEVKSSVENGTLVFDIVRTGDEFDDIVVTLKTAPVKYDTTFLQKLMGDKPKYAEYIEDMKTGPWSANIDYRLTGDSVLTTGDKHFSLRCGDDVSTVPLSSKAANTGNTSKDLTVSENDEFTFDIIMGTKTSGPLPAGKYYLFAELNISGLAEKENQKLSYLESIPALIQISADILKSADVKSIFNISSWLSFYFLTVVLGCLFFAYPDLRSSFIMATSGKGNITKITYYIYINGFCTGEVTGYKGTGGFSIIGFILFYLLLLFTIPIRIVAQIINCIVRIILGDDYDYCDPLFANIIGSVGVYAALTTAVALISAVTVSGNYTVAIIAGILAVALLIVANLLSKAREDM